MIKYIVSFVFILTILNAEGITQDDENTQELETEIITETEHESKVDCLILEDENSIICKFETQRKTNDEQIIMQWIDPQGDISRSRDMLIPAGHGSIYDYRYLNGRLLGTWTFKVISNDIVYETKFELN